MPQSNIPLLASESNDFDAYAESENCRVLRSAYLIGSALFVFAFVYEAIALQGRFTLPLIVGAFAWVGLQAAWLHRYSTNRGTPPNHRIRAAVVVSNGWMWVVLSALTTHPGDAAPYGNEFVLIQTVFAYLCSGLRLRLAAASGLSIAALMPVVLATLSQASSAAIAHVVFVLVAVNLVGALGRWWIEQNQRAEYAERTKLRAQTLTDPLTGAANRVGFAEHATELLNIAREQHLYVGMAMLDLDKFKPINDRFGHAAGDAMLCHVAALLRGCVGRSTDRIARLGGDEFGAIWCGRSLADIYAVADTLHATTQRIELNIARQPIPLTAETSASIGVLAVYPARQPALVNRLIDHADQLATTVKQLGGQGMLIRELNTDAEGARCPVAAPPASSTRLRVEAEAAA